MSLHFGAWRGCDCTDITTDPAAIPERCPCHGTGLLGTCVIERGAEMAALGHKCKAAKVGTREGETARESHRNRPRNDGQAGSEYQDVRNDERRSA